MLVRIVAVSVSVAHVSVAVAVVSACVAAGAVGVATRRWVNVLIKSSIQLELISIAHNIQLNSTTAVKQQQGQPLKSNSDGFEVFFRLLL